jgi:signal transduction histidine kinase
VSRRVGVAGVVMVAWTAVAVFGFLQNQPSPPYSPSELQYGFNLSEVLIDIAQAWAFILAGLVVWQRRARSVIGPLMIGVGGAVLIYGLVFMPIPFLVSLGLWLEGGWGLTAVLLGALVLMYPDGRIGSRLHALWLVAAAAYLVIRGGAALVTPAIDAYCDCRPFLTLSWDENVTWAWTNTAYLFFLALSVFLLVLVIRRWLRASGPARRTLLPILVAGGLFAGVVVTEQLLWRARDVGLTPSALSGLRGFLWSVSLSIEPIVFPIARLSLLFIPIALLWGLLRSQLGQAAVARLVRDLRGHRIPLLAAVRRAVGDPSLEVALWSRTAGAYVTQDGQPVALPDPESGRGVTAIEGEDGPLAAFIHDPALAEHQGLVEGVAGVAQLALENERLHAEVKAQLEEVRASRQRIVQAADEERRRVERNIHDGAQQRLVAMAVALRMARERADDASELSEMLTSAERDVRAAIDELRTLARGIHPAILSEAGLQAALESLADHAPVPVRVAADLDGRLPPVVEATAYFVAAEALTNACKHADASEVTLSASVRNGWLQVSVADDGIGGADPDRGSGLRGLLDRVAALGGRLRIDAGGGGGTRVTAEIPCA